jgi:Cof subfamily protein (haloacid dehalogenase superfamily)
MSARAKSDRAMKLFATDLDGTLLRSDNTASDATREAVAEALAQDVQVVFVTGRPTRWLWEVVDQVGHTGIVVASNGALTIDLTTETVLHTAQLDVDVLEAATKTLRAEFPDVVFAVEADTGFVYEHGYVHDWTIAHDRDRQGKAVSLPEPRDFADLLSAPGVIKLLAKIPGSDPDAFTTAASTVLGDTVTVTSSAKSALIEISAVGVTKASGLSLHCERHGISADEVVAVGDMPNDVPMLEWAGHGYAVANAHPAAKECADAVLPWTNDDDAVAKLLRAGLAGTLP